MDAVAAGTLGLPWLLRTWRTDVSRLSLRQLDERGVVRKPTLSMWENGHRAVGFRQLELLDECYGAGHALVDLALALGTPAGLPARTTWAHNPQGPSAPRWAWLRPGPGAGRVDALLTWGAFAIECAEPCDDRGVFVTTPMSMPNPAVWVHLREAGWVDFGRGAVPEELGIPVRDALSGARVARHGHSPAGLVAPRLVARFLSDPAFADRVLRFFGSRPDLVRQVFSTTEGYDRVLDLAGDPGRVPPTTEDRPFTGSRFRALREARGLSQADTARLVTELLPEDPVTDDQIGSLERGANPRAAFLRSRLDRVYGADGVTCVEEVSTASTRPPFVFSFPIYWIGPVWFTFDTPDDAPALVELHWATGYKRLRVAPGTTVTCRRPVEDPIAFVVVCPRRWRVVAGMGAHPQAHDVNFGWLRTDGDDPQRYDGHEVNEIFLNWFDRTPEEFTVFLRDVDIDGDADRPV